MSASSKRFSFIGAVFFITALLFSGGAFAQVTPYWGLEVWESSGPDFDQFFPVCTDPGGTDGLPCEQLSGLEVCLRTTAGGANIECQNSVAPGRVVFNNDGAGLTPGTYFICETSNQYVVTSGFYNASFPAVGDDCVTGNIGEGDNTTTVMYVEESLVDIVITKKSDPNPSEMLAGDCTDCNYHEYTVTNNGPSDATNLVTTLAYLPYWPKTGVTVTETESVGTFTGGNGGTWTIPTLANGASATLKLLFSAGPDAPATDPSDLPETRLRSRLSFTSVDQNLLNPVANQQLVSDILRESVLTISKTADLDPLVARGETLTYTIKIDNAGPSDADDLVVKDTLPPNLDPTLPLPTDCSWDGTLDTVTCINVSVAANSFGTIDIAVPIPAQYPLGPITNTVVLDPSNSLSDTTGSDYDDAVESRVVVARPGEGTAIIAVQKFFRDGNDETPVTLTLECGTGTYAPASVTVNPDEFAPGSVFEHFFVVANISESVTNPCTVVEEPVAGYEATYICGQAGSTSTVDDTLCNPYADFTAGTTACGWLDVQEGDSNLCGIFNDPSPVDVDVTKVWETFGAAQADVDPDVTITLTCNPARGIVGGTNPYGDKWIASVDLEVGAGDFDDEDGDYVGVGTAEFEVIPSWFPTSADPDDQEYTRCWAVESVSDDLVEVDNGCGDDADSATLEVAVGMGDECTITNTVFFEGIPTLSQYGMALMALLMLGVGFVGLRRFV